ncbi:MAG: ATP-binding protein [Janthinobacterium lividum]
MAASQPVDNVTTVDFRQLRHQTKNALTSILAQVSAGMTSPEACRRTAADVERRILLTAQISDALFGLTRAPGPFAQRLGSLCDGVVGLASETDQYVTVSCCVSAEPPVAMAETVLRVAHEFVANAVKHGMHMRLLGRIEVSIATMDAGLVLTVVDDGWGCGMTPSAGEGLSVAHALATAIGGEVSLRRVGDRTISEMKFAAALHA